MIPGSHQNKNIRISDPFSGTGGFLGSKVAIGVAKAFPDRQIYALTRGKSLSNKILKNISNLNCDLLESDLEKTLPSCIHTILHFAANSKTFVPNEEFNNQFFNFTNNILIIKN